MSDYTATGTPGVSVKTSLDWGKLGEHFAGASSTDQADFLEGWADAMSVWLDTAAHSQISSIAAAVNDVESEYPVGHIGRLLGALNEAIGADDA